MHDVSVHTRRGALGRRKCGLGFGLLRKYGQRARSDRGSVHIRFGPVRYHERACHHGDRSNRGCPDAYAVCGAHYERASSNDGHARRNDDGPDAHVDGLIHRAHDE